MPKAIPDNIETVDCLTETEHGIEALAAAPLSDKPGFDGYLVTWYTLTDRGTYFTPGSFKKTINERLKINPHLYMHDTWEPVGKHVAAFEDEKGVRIGVEINEGVQRGADIMSNLRFGTPMAISAGIDRVKSRPGTPEDDKKLNRKAAPALFKDIPIEELIALDEVKWWESSTVTFPGLGTAKADVVHSADGSPWELSALIEGLKAGNLTAAQRILVESIVEAHQASAVAQGTGDTDHEGDPAPKDRRLELAALAAMRGRLIATGATL